MSLTDIFIIIILIWFAVLIIAIVTLAKRRDIGVATKSFWSAVLFIAPVVGLVFYLIYGFGSKKSNITRY